MSCDLVYFIEYTIINPIDDAFNPGPVENKVEKPLKTSQKHLQKC